MNRFKKNKYIVILSVVWSVQAVWVTTIQASDIEIYKSAQKGEVVILLMLDTSASMDLNNAPIAERKAACDFPKDVFNDPSTLFWKRQPHSKPERGYLVNYCKDNEGKKYTDRITRLKDALYELAMSNAIDPNTKIGVGTYPYFNKAKNDLNNRAYMRIAADKWGLVGSPQRQKVLNLIRDPNFEGIGGTPTSEAYAEAAAYMLGTTSGDTSSSGISIADKKYSSNIVTGEGWSKKYVSPLSRSQPSECDGKGIYFMTDGVPESPRATNFRTPMAKAIGVDEYLIVDRSGLAGGRFSNHDKFQPLWGAIGLFARYLNDQNRMKKLLPKYKDPRLRTAVIGFGSDFDVNPNIKKVLVDPITQRSRTYYDCNAITNVDTKNACNWGEKSRFSDGKTVTIAGVGGYGEGGFYSAKSTDELINSVVNFVEESKPEFEPLIMGSPSIPLDSLNPIQLHPFGYYSTFIPKPASGYRLWQGNLNKYHIYNGELFNAEKTIRLIKPSGEIDQRATGIWGEGGVKALLPLGLTQQPELSSRRVFSNRVVDAASKPEAAAELIQVDLQSLLGVENGNALLKNDPDKNYWLNFLGYRVAINADISNILALKNESHSSLRQMGAVLHSKPILLTQAGRIRFEMATQPHQKNKISSEAREDYLLFGSTQGVLHVVDDNGKEVFAFVPHELMQSQKQALLSVENTAGATEKLFYGIDATWTAHTEYMSKADGMLTVKNSSQTIQTNLPKALNKEFQLADKSVLASIEHDDLNLQGKQWVYGGLRMGGNNYYALDLTEITQPKFKFQIDPVHKRIMNPRSSKNVDALGFMGQSWSKPTVVYVKWNGKKKLVMFVGGGYDAIGKVQCAASTADHGVTQQQNHNAELARRKAFDEGINRDNQKATVEAEQAAQRDEKEQQRIRDYEERASTQSREQEESGGDDEYQDRQQQARQKAQEQARRKAYSDAQRKARALAQRQADQRMQRVAQEQAYRQSYDNASSQAAQPAQRHSDPQSQYNDQGYECPTYQQDNAIGAGVYMFDADNGELLWWSSRNATAALGAVEATYHQDLKYSVVSQINSLDRDNDGLVDTLYFADLGGQVFRIDLDNTARSTATFAKRVFRLYNGHLDNGLSPRFYEMPSFSVHQDPLHGLYGIVSFSSGNVSSPLAGAGLSAQDGVYAIFDHDIARVDLYDDKILLNNAQANGNSPQPTLLNLNLGVMPTTRVNGRITYNLGWWHPFSARAGAYKGLSEVFTLDNILYANVYDKEGVGIGAGCGAKVIGDSYLFQYCLPTGKCKAQRQSDATDAPYRMKIGAGILSTGLAKGYLNIDGTMSVAINRGENTIQNCTRLEARNLAQCQLFESQSSIKSMRWYEHRSN